jgi:hypothetical protein
MQRDLRTIRAKALAICMIGISGSLGGCSGGGDEPSANQPNPSSPAPVEGAPLEGRAEVTNVMPNGSDVLTDSMLRVEFSKAMNSTVTAAAIRVEPPVTCSDWQWNDNYTQATCVPTSPLQPSTSYVVRVLADARASNGQPLQEESRSTFSTVAALPMTQIARLLSASPVGERVLQNATIKLGFDRPMNMQLAQQKVAITPAVDCQWIWNAARTAVTCRPTNPLAVNTTYRIHVPSDLAVHGSSPATDGFTATFETSTIADNRQAGIRVFARDDTFIDEEGTFRLSCFPSHMSRDDPIVFPDQSGRTHLHVFFGNTGADAFSSVASVETSGATTCHGGTLNRSAYWTPALLSNTGQPLWPMESSFYYKATALKGVRETIQPFPPGLRMIAGRATASPSAPQRSGALSIVCDTRPTGGTATTRNDQVSIPPCAKGNEMIVQINFPQCWDGVNLDSADHASHMAYAATDRTGKTSCPTTHPVAVPTVIQKVFYTVTAQTGTAGWHFSSDAYNAAQIQGGYSLHADWINGWDQATLQRWVTNCINEGRHCANGQLGDGTGLTLPQDIGQRAIRQSAKTDRSLRSFDPGMDAMCGPPPTPVFR